MSRLTTFRRVIMFLDDFQLLFSPIHQLYIHVFIFIEITVVTVLYIQRLEQKHTHFSFSQSSNFKIHIVLFFDFKANVYLSTLLITLKILSVIILKYQRRIKDQIKREREREVYHQVINYFDLFKFHKSVGFIVETIETRKILNER